MEMNVLKERAKNLSWRAVSWMKDYCGDRIDTLVVGVSGGIDSAVVERLCELTGKKVICISMPMTNDPVGESTERAMELCSGRNVTFITKTIASIVESYKDSGIEMDRLSEGNLRSRIRANILYNYAGMNNGIVVGTGNKDEDTIGYFTKGGDGLVDICPLSDIHKSDVYKMAGYLDVPSRTLNAVPTAELWDGQTDEQELGMNYNEVEWAIKMLSIRKKLELEKDEWASIRKDFSKCCRDRQLIVLDKVYHMKKKNAHKLSYPPIFMV